MRIPPRIRVTMMVVLAAAVGGFSSLLVSEAHEDAGGPERLNDSVKVTEVTALTDQDDGVNGLSEYCIRITIAHPEHIGESESVDCVNVNWDDTDQGSGQAWQDLNRLPLIGEQGYAGTAWESVDHTRECIKSAPWTLRVRLTETNTFELGDILEEIGKALTQSDVAGATGGKVFLYGKAAQLAGKILRDLFGDLENLGAIPLKWVEGEGDPTGTVPKGPDRARHFRAEGEKTVTEIAKDCKPSTTTTPTGTGTGTQPPPPTPTDTTPTETETTPTETETTPTETETTPTETETTPTETETTPTGTETTPTGTETTPTTTTLAPPLAQAAQRRPACGSDERHIFCKNVSRARASWRALDRAARMIRRLRREPGTRRRVDVKGMRRNLIRLVGRMGRYSADTELAEAKRVRLNRRGQRVRARARVRIRRGKRLQARAQRRVSPALLRRALRRYRAAHLALLPRTHPSFNRRR